MAEPSSLFNSRRRSLTPAQLIVLSFLGAIAAGTLLLALPFTHAPGYRVSVLDALFTATSAVCVTGLVVVDTGSAYNRLGQFVIMVLFQAGGLGILTLGALLALATRRRVGFSQRMRLQAQVNALQVGGVIRLVRSIFVVVLTTELLGAALLYLRFAQTVGVSDGVFYALFHSISAFNNAGFALYPDSLTRFVGDPLVNLTVIALIVLGGLGFVVILDIFARFRERRRTPFSLTSKLVLVSTVVLTAGALVFITVLEWANPATLAPLPLGSKLLGSLFQAVVPRTAGFNTLDYSQMTTASLVMTILLMFIGANPSSTGGGIKTVTFVVLLGSAWAVIRNKGELNLYGRRVALFTVVRAGVIAFGAAMTIGAAVTLLAVSDADKGLLNLLFEAVSAFATVGLSLGVTAELSVFGKWVIIVLMYLGRVGLVTFALALVEEEPDRDIRYPTEDVTIG